MANGPAPTPEQQKALSGLVESGTLTGEQAAAVNAALFGPARMGSPVPVLTEIGGYVGGGLIIGGAMLLVGLNLDRFGQRNAAIILAGYALALLLAGVLAGGGLLRAAALRGDGAPARRRLVGVLLAIASAPAALSAALFNDGRAAALTAGLIGLAVALAGYVLLPTVPGLLALAATSVTAVIGGLNLADHPAQLVPTFAFVGLGLLFGLAGAAGLLQPRRIAMALGAAIAIAGAHLAMVWGETRAWTYGLTFLIGLICFLVYWVDRSTVLMVFGVIATTIAIPEAVTDWTDDSLSGPAILLISGAVLVAASGVGLWLRNLRRPEIPV